MKRLLAAVLLLAGASAHASLEVDGTWRAGVWATTVWATGVWYEGVYVPSETDTIKSYFPIEFAETESFAVNVLLPIASDPLPLSV